MHSNTDGMNLINQGVGVDFKYFIQSAIQKEIPWKSLAFFITNLIMSLDQSKEVIKILVDELEIWVLKVQNEIGNEMIEVPEIEDQGEDQGTDIKDFRKHLKSSIPEEETQEHSNEAIDNDSDTLPESKILDDLSAETANETTKNLNQYYTFVGSSIDVEKDLGDPTKRCFKDELISQPVLEVENEKSHQKHEEDEIKSVEKEITCIICEKKFSNKRN